MKRVVAASASVIALFVGSAAAAAELPRKAAKPVYKAEPAPAIALPNWTGFYLGGNIGSSVGAHPSNVTALSGGGLITVAPGTPLFGGSRNFMLAPDGWNGGVQAGYNWQFAPQWLVGVEADIQFSAAKDGTDCNLPCGAPIGLTAGAGTRLFPVTFSENSNHSELNWFGTLRGRLAYAAGPALFYATGGLAYGEVSSSGRVAGAIIGAISGTQFSTFAGSFDSSDVRTGWTAGWGIEAQLGGNWSVKKEYLYLDLGTSTNTFNAVFLPGSANTGLAASYTVNRTYASTSSAPA